MIGITSPTGYGSTAFNSYINAIENAIGVFVQSSDEQLDDPNYNEAILAHFGLSSADNFTREYIVNRVNSAR